jgi:hypothetical protein
MSQLFCCYNVRTVHVMLFLTINVLYFYIIISRSNCAVRSAQLSCSSLISCSTSVLFRNVLNDCEMIPLVPVIAVIICVFTFHMRTVSIVRYLHFQIFPASWSHNLLKRQCLLTDMFLLSPIMMSDYYYYYYIQFLQHLFGVKILYHEIQTIYITITIQKIYITITIQKIYITITIQIIYITITIQKIYITITIQTIHITITIQTIYITITIQKHYKHITWGISLSYCIMDMYYVCYHWFILM